MSQRGDDDEHHDDKAPGGFWSRWRRSFLTGLVVIAPLYLTVWLIWSVVGLIDSKVERLLPSAYSFDQLGGVPGYGLLIFVVFTALVGAIAKNFVAVRLIAWGEAVLDKLPIVRSIYNGIKQIAQTVLVQSRSSFQKACLIEYPRKGLWAIAFIATRANGEILRRSGQTELMAVFMPTTPNPTSGFLLFVPKSEVIELDMSVEEAAKLIISAGLVTPDDLRAEAARNPVIKAAE